MSHPLDHGTRAPSALVLTGLIFLALFGPLPPRPSMMDMTGQAEGLVYSGDVSVDSLNVTFLGTVLEGGAGRSVAIAGDVNGDGLDDILIGAPAANGTIYLFFGHPSGWWDNIDVKNADVVITGENNKDWAGFSVAGAGDVNGDGYDDIIIGAPGNKEDREEGYYWSAASGQAYIIFGKPSNWEPRMSLADADASFLGKNEVYGLGYVVKGVGDVNADGLDDVLIEARYDTYEYMFIDIIFGKHTGWKMDEDIHTGSDVSMMLATSTYHDPSFAGVGDINRDGFDDILFGVPEAYGNAWRAGVTHIVFGRSNWPRSGDVSVYINVLIKGQGDYALSGTSVAGLGDVNGDGLDDFAIGAPRAVNGTIDTGIVYIFYGNATVDWGTQRSITTADAWFYGPVKEYGLGTNVIGPGDVDGDGLNDLLVAGGNTWEDYTGWSNVSFVLGKPGGWSGGANILAAATTTFHEERLGDKLGTSMDGGGDVNGDGKDDFIIGAPKSDSVIDDGGKVYLAMMDTNDQPSPVQEIRTYRSQSMDPSTEKDTFKMGDRVYVKLKSSDTFTTSPHLATVHLSSASSRVGIMLDLHETGPQSGTFTGSFVIKSTNNEERGWVMAAPGDAINITPVADPSINAIVHIEGLSLIPGWDLTTIEEDSQYIMNYTILSIPSSVWSFGTNNSWMAANKTGNVISLSGTPDNRHVGTSWVKLTVSDSQGLLYERPFNVLVTNRPPVINTTDITNAKERTIYRVHYECDDDDMGNVEWSMVTEAPWLSFDHTSAVLEGTPSRKDIGDWWVNISVDDGNGGRTFHNFTISVEDANDPPIIITQDVKRIMEDKEYRILYKAYDIEEEGWTGTSQYYTWDMTTNASWLAINSTSGLLNGTPDNGDVGLWWVNVTVKDPENATDHHNFTLMVQNTNDPPIILGPDLNVTMEDVPYEVDYNATDPDEFDAPVEWRISTKAKWLHIDPRTGVLTGTPDDADIGTWKVNISVSDFIGDLGYREFNVTVVPRNDPPAITTVDVLTALEDEYYVVFYMAKDQEGDLINWSMTTNAGPWLTLGKDGKLSGTPSNDDIGHYSVNITVSDGDLSSSRLFVLRVVNINDPPVLMTPGNIDIRPGSDLDVSLTASDPDPAATTNLSFALVTGPEDMTVDPFTGRISWHPGKRDVGTRTIVVMVTDGESVTSGSFDITVKEGKGTGSDIVSSDLQPALWLLMALLVAIIAVLTQRLVPKAGHGKGPRPPTRPPPMDK